MEDAMSFRKRKGISRRGLLASVGASVSAFSARAAPEPAGFVNILRPPDAVTAFTESESVPLSHRSPAWTARSIRVESEPSGNEIPVIIQASGAPLTRIHMRWRQRVPEGWRIQGDHWERSYGDLEWRGLVGERILPWYFLAFAGHVTHGYGVATGAGALCFWQTDAAGISLWLDVRNGGRGVNLGGRSLEAAFIRPVAGRTGETSFEFARRFCHVLCPNPRLPDAPVYGGNNWYYTYGENFSDTDILRDSDLIASLSPDSGNRPFMVIDDAWQADRQTAGPWNRGNEKFPDMPRLAADMKHRGVRPGIWMRPLFTTASLPAGWQLPGHPAGTIDPSVPEALEHVRQDIRRLASWGFELIKHDFSTYDMLGRWGFAMKAELTPDGWQFADRSRTTSEIALALYRAIRDAAGSAILIGCNTFGHLSAGIHELQRIGDDTSGRDFNRTRRMGVNALAFRAAQHGTFFAADADCAAITPMLPWGLASRWLDLVARSGTPLFVSADPRAMHAERKRALQSAFTQASRPQLLAEPLDWFETTTPARWRFGDELAGYDWFGPDGASPFPK
jgi:alpha-galactosidase